MNRKKIKTKAITTELAENTEKSKTKEMEREKAKEKR